MQKLAAGKWLRVCLLFSAVTLPLFFSGCLGAGSVTPPSSDISGTWSVTVTPTSGVAQTYNVTIAQTGSSITVTGTILGTSVSATGTYVGQTVTFSFTDTAGNIYAFTGTVNTDGTSMSGTYTENGSQAGTWTATETSSDPTNSIVGTWNMVLTVGGTPQPSTIWTFSQSGNTVSAVGTIVNQAGQIQNGTFSTVTITNSNISFTWTSSDQTTTLTFAGTIVSATSMNGSYTSTDTTIIPSGTWSATKVS